MAANGRRRAAHRTAAPLAGVDTGVADRIRALLRGPTTTPSGSVRRTRCADPCGHRSRANHRSRPRLASSSPKAPTEPQLTSRTTRATIPRATMLGWLLMALLAALITWVLIHHGRPLVWDVALHRAALHDRTSALTSVAIVVTTTGEAPAYAVAVLGGVLALRPRPWWLGAVAGAAFLLVGQLIRVTLAVSIGRLRPPVVDWAWHASGPALPSGHTTTSALAAGLLCLGLARCLHKATLAAAITATVAWATTVGLTRIYLGVHWPSDVLAGWLLAAALTVAAQRLLAKMSAASSPSTPQRS
jgi:membrane-associated phospholipid phosphatase